MSVPSINLVPNVLGDAFVIAIVIFAINITICKMFAKKGDYSIDPSQVSSTEEFFILTFIYLFIY